ncbi:protein of unknown function [Petrocella atlantisensis]|uniref:Uncharacterized protein n=1 Tax=Petrocella atlantisensis TaxID=2173034 RepID=A0A3P7S1B8_9FIRM|nr:protein of unknown function [Petrocella atlantisensis]
MHEKTVNEVISAKSHHLLFTTILVIHVRNRDFNISHFKDSVI